MTHGQHDSEDSGFKKDREFTDQLSEYQLLKTEYVH
jgi:hypothetical protein